MIIGVLGGLCNRLRVILSYKRTHRDLDVVWPANDEVTGARFEDVFEPLRGVRFHHEGTADFWTNESEKGIAPAWEDLYPLPRVTSVVSGLQRANGMPYIQIHVRRMDVTYLAKAAGHMTSDQDFADWVKNRPGFPLYISCDNRETQERLATRFEKDGRNVFLPPFLLVGQENVERGQAPRHASMLHSVVNMYMGVDARDFMGSYESSGVVAIQKLREIRGNHAR